MERERGHNSRKVIFSQSVSRDCVSGSPFALLAQAVSRVGLSGLFLLSLLLLLLILSLIAEPACHPSQQHTAPLTGRCVLLGGILSHLYHRVYSGQQSVLVYFRAPYDISVVFSGQYGSYICRQMTKLQATHIALYTLNHQHKCV